MEIPVHVAIIMDGNGRWAQKQGFPRTFGHREGVHSLRRTLEHAGKLGIRYLTVYAFSTENWKRSPEEVNTLMRLFKRYLKQEEKNLMEKDVRFLVSGRKEGVSPDLLSSIARLEQATQNNKGLTFHVAFNYGGRSEIVDAVNRILVSGKKEISEEDFSSYLYQQLPDPELLIRTSGEFRVSNFLLWQIAYSEIYICETLWPDFSEKDLDAAVSAYNMRERRFGGN
jgi:undecaprenyl diphosphate synthase